jgi:hypothetical protein
MLLRPTRARHTQQSTRDFEVPSLAMSADPDNRRSTGSSETGTAGHRLKRGLGAANPKLADGRKECVRDEALCTGEA